MSWSVSTSGKVIEVVKELGKQFKYPLADKPSGLTDDGERETVERIRETILQCLDTFGPERTVSVAAHGHMGYANWDTKAGAYQEVSLTIKPLE